MLDGVDPVADARPGADRMTCSRVSDDPTADGDEDADTPIAMMIEADVSIGQRAAADSGTFSNALADVLTPAEAPAEKLHLWTGLQAVTARASMEARLRDLRNVSNGAADA